MLEPAELLVTANPRSWQREMYRDLPTQGVTVVRVYNTHDPDDRRHAECASRLQAAESAAEVKTASPRNCASIRAEAGLLIAIAGSATERGRFS